MFTKYLTLMYPYFIQIDEVPPRFFYYWFPNLSCNRFKVIRNIQSNLFKPSFTIPSYGIYSALKNLWMIILPCLSSSFLDVVILICIAYLWTEEFLSFQNLFFCLLSQNICDFMQHSICKLVRVGGGEEKEFVKEIKSKLMKHRCITDVVGVRLTCILRHGTEEVLRFRICLFCVLIPNICDFIVYLILCTYLLVHIYGTEKSASENFELFWKF